MLRVLLLIGLVVTTAVGQQVDTLAPDAGTLGTVLTISGSGFGAKKGHVLLVGDEGKPHKLVVSAWSDTLVEARVRRAPPAGPATVQVHTTDDGLAEIAFTLLAPTPLGLDKTLSSPRELVRVSVADLGDRRPRVYVGWRRMPIRSVKDDPELPGVRVVRFRIPRRALPTGVWNVRVTNAVGEGVLETALQITGSKRRWIHRPRVVGTLDGEAFQARASRDEVSGDGAVPLWLVTAEPSSKHGPIGALSLRMPPPAAIPDLSTGTPDDGAWVGWTEVVDGVERSWDSEGGSLALTLQAATKRQIAGIVHAVLVAPGLPDRLFDAAFVAHRP